MLLKAKSYNLKATPGFTLIELLVVIAIIGLLSSIVLASLGAARSKAADAAIQADLVGVRSSAEIYYSSKGDYAPNFLRGLCPSSVQTSMFGGAGLYTAPQIFSAIKAAAAQGAIIAPFDQTVCAANSTSYAVAVALKTQPDPTNNPKYFCVDSTGATIIVTDTGSGAIVDPAPYVCVP